MHSKGKKKKKGKIEETVEKEIKPMLNFSKN